MLIVITGRSGSGKTTAVRRVLKTCREPIYGFWTEKMPAPPQSQAPVYLHSFQQALCYGADNCIGSCRDKHATAFPDVFEHYGVAVLQSIPNNAFVVFDEIGFMENEASRFCEALKRLCGSERRVLITVRDRATPLLDALRELAGAYNYTAQQANTEPMAAQLSALLFGTQA